MAIKHHTIPPAGTINAIDEPQWAESHDIDAGGLVFNDATVQTTAFAVPGSTTQVIFNNAGALGASVTLTYATSTRTLVVGGGGALTGGIVVAGATGATSLGNTLTIRGGPGGATSGIGGALNLYGGVPTLGAGGDVNIASADGVGAGKSAGTVNISGGLAGSGSANGGGVNLIAGNSTGSGRPGSFTLNAGNANGNADGGSFSATGGVGGITGAGGSATFSGGSAGSSGDGGSITFNGGACIDVNKTGGSINFNGGSSTFFDSPNYGGNISFVCGFGDVQANDGIFRVRSGQGTLVCKSDTNANFITGQACADQSAFIDTTAGDRTIPSSISTYISNAGAQVAVTLTMPTSPIDGQIIEILSVATITTLTFAAAGTISDTYAAILHAGQALRYRYNAALTSWFRLI